MRGSVSCCAWMSKAVQERACPVSGVLPRQRLCSAEGSILDSRDQHVRVYAAHAKRAGACT